LPHLGDMTRVAALRPRFVSLRRLFQVRKDLLAGTTGLTASHTPKNSPLVIP
jgi:hypothetical protein